MPVSHENPPKLGLPSATAVVAASMIGAGVYTTSGFTLADLRYPSAVILAWMIGGLIATCGAICYGSLVRRITESGGEYVFLAREVHPAAGMTAGWVSLLAGFTGAMAFAATTFGVYASAWFPEDAIFSSKASSWLASLIVVVAALAHGSGLKRGTHIQNTVVGIKLLFIGTFLLIAYGCVSSWWSLPLATDVTEPASVASTDTGDPTAWSKALLFANSLTWISLSFSGFNAAVYMTDEIENPRRNVPRAMVLGTLAVSVLYLLLNTVFVYAAPPSEVLGRPDVAMAAVAALSDTLADAGWPLAEHLETLVRVAITLGLATSVLALMQTGPRVYRKMATDQLLPKVLAGNEQSSAAAIALQAGLALIVIWTSTLREQLDYLGFTLSVCAALCCALVLRTPKRHQIDPALDATGDSDTSGVSERVWGFPIVPVIYVAGTLLIATLTAIRSPEQALVGLGTLLVGVISYTGMTKLWGSRNP